MAHPHSSAGTPEASDAGETARIELDDLFEVLGERWRRCAVRHLAKRPDGRAADEFVADLHARYAPPTADRSSTRIAFHHVHLPKLDALDVVDYDRESGTVAPGPNFDEAAACLDAVEDALA